jgi:hypothetical protein
MAAASHQRSHVGAANLVAAFRDERLRCRVLRGPGSSEARVKRWGQGQLFLPGARWSSMLTVRERLICGRQALAHEGCVLQAAVCP